MTMTAHPAALPAAAPAFLSAPAVIPALDGLRALSILLVMASHSTTLNIIPGVFGVTIFFFVSGYLITNLLLDEHASQGGIAIGAFYIRRFLRLYPPLVVSLLATAAFYAVIGKPVDPLGVLGALAYLANYLAIFRPDLMQNLGGQLWSLAVEEHFYVVYPLLLAALLPRRARTLAVVAALCLAALAVRMYVEARFPAIAVDYTGKATETRIDSILYGAVAALIWRMEGPRAFLARHFKPLLALSFAVLLGCLAWRNQTFRDTLRYSLQGLALIVPVLAVTAMGVLPWAQKALDSPPLRFIGRISYGLYLWHLLAFEMAAHLLPGAGAVHVFAVALGWGLAFGLAMLSYRFVEAPFFALRKRFGSNVGKISG